MKSNVEMLENSQVRITIEASKELFMEGINESFKKNKNKFNIKGFRKGKVPMAMVEKMYGEGAFYEDAFNYVFSKAYPEAVKESNLDVVSRADIEEVKQIGKGKDLIFSVLVTVKPEVELGEYKGIEAKKVAVRVTAKDIEEKLSVDREKNSRIVEAARAAENGDIVNIDFEGFVDGEAFEGGKGEGYDLTLGTKTFIDTFESQLEGKKVDEELEVNVKFPKEYHSEALAGKKAMFKVKINSIKVKELPELDDDFAQDISEFDTMDELKKDLKEKIREEKKARATREMENTVLETAVNGSKVEIPAVMIENRMENIVQDFEHRLSHQGLNLEKYLQMINKTMDEFRENMKPDAEKQVKTSLVMEKIAEVEKLEASKEDLDKELERLAVMYNSTKEILEKNFSEDDYEALKDDLKVKKAFELVIESRKEA